MLRAAADRWPAPAAHDPLQPDRRELPVVQQLQVRAGTERDHRVPARRHRLRRRLQMPEEVRDRLLVEAGLVREGRNPHHMPASRDRDGADRAGLERLAGHSRPRRSGCHGTKRFSGLEQPQPRPRFVTSTPAGVDTFIGMRFSSHSGGTDDVWFYDVRADGFTLDDKRNPIETSDLTDVLLRGSGERPS